MKRDTILSIINNIKDNKISTEEALKIIEDLPFKDLDFVKLDTHREIRRDYPEVIFCKNKSIEQLELICKELAKSDQALYSKVNKKKATKLIEIDPKLEYNPLAKMLYKGIKVPRNNKIISIVSAGTSDIPIAEEAKISALLMGNIVNTYYDVGVAGIHRFFSIYDKLRESNVIVVIAGMEGALVSVVAGLVSSPVIAVPTSCGYGASFKGIAPLLTMLNSCSPGVSVVNIDNGFGAGYLASVINGR